MSDEGDQGDNKDQDAQDEDLRGGKREKHAGQPVKEGWDEWQVSRRKQPGSWQETEGDGGGGGVAGRCAVVRVGPVRTIVLAADWLVILSVCVSCGLCEAS